MNDTLTGALIGFGGAVLAVIITLTVSWLQERARQRRERHNVRILIRLENAKNLKALHDCWAEVQQNALPVGSVLGFSTDEVAYLKRHKLASLVLPPWSRLMWESLASQLAGALSPEELELTYALHTALDVFSTQRSAMGSAFAEEVNAKVWREYGEWRERASQAVIVSERPIPSFQPGVLAACNQDTEPVWAACEGIANGVGLRGNPVGPDEAPHGRQVTISGVRAVWKRLRRRADIVATNQ